jgi:hypothetical protein
MVRTREGISIFTGGCEHSFETWSSLVDQSGTRLIRGWNWIEFKRKQGKKKSGVTQLTRRVDPTTRLQIR